MSKVINITPKEIAKALYDLLDKIEELEDKYENAVADYEYEKCKNNQAIKYIVKNCILSDEWTELDFCNFIPTGKITYKQLTSKKVKELLKILGDKEHE